MGFSTHLKAFKKIRRRLNHPSTPVHSSHGPQAHTGHAILYCILVGVCGLSYAPVTQFKTKASMLHLLSILSLYQTLTNKRSNSPAMWYKILIWLKHLTHLYLYLLPTSIWLVVGAGIPSLQPQAHSWYQFISVKQGDLSEMLYGHFNRLLGPVCKPLNRLKWLFFFPFFLFLVNSWL